MKTPGLLTLFLVLALGAVIPLSVLSAADAKQVSDGQVIFKKNCNMCHHADKASKKLGPGLKGLFKNKELPESHQPVSEALVREQITEGTKAMPAFGKKLSSDQIDDLIAYLKTL